MPHYQPPLRDLQFVQQEMFDIEALYAGSDRWTEVNAELLSTVREECARFASEVLVPLNIVGDREGCQQNGDVVTTPNGFKEAYTQFVEGGWPALESSEEFGGQGLPRVLSIAVSEMIGTANWAWSMYPGLSHGACHTIDVHGSQEQRERFLPALVSGRWTGTMCLTEAHCGSDLGLLRTKAEPAEDGSYRITGSKIFISSGEHDMAENIVHITLARLPDAPKGTEGISLFIVPKFIPTADGQPGERNKVAVGSLEEKMGIHGNATCVMNFDGATGYLLGKPNRGLQCMFTFMNFARIGTAIQGLAHAEFGYQNSLAYARERLQMRALSGAKVPDKEADPIITHPDVRRMLLTQRAFAEGGRMLIYYMARLLDEQTLGDEKTKAAIEEQLSFLTPIAKAFMTEVGFESANLGMQIFGGHGYIREWGMEQNVRDARIAMIYEGTTGIQSLDLLGRKVLSKQGKPLIDFAATIEAFCAENEGNATMTAFVEPLRKVTQLWQGLTMEIGGRAMKNPDEINAACVDYLMYSGYTTFAYLWARAAATALAAIAAGNDDLFYRNKLYLAQFYFKRLLPRTRALAATMNAGLDSVSAETDPFAQY